MIGLARAVVLLLLCAGVAGAVTPRELAHAIELADDRRFDEALRALRALIGREPGAIEPWLALHELAGLGTEDGRLHPRPAEQAVRKELQRLGPRAPAALRRFLAAWLAGARAPRSVVRLAREADAWGSWLRARRELQSTFPELERALPLVDRAWSLGRDGPLGFYLADRIADLPGLPPKVRDSFRGWALRRARADCPRLAPRYLLPRRPLPSGEFVDRPLPVEQYRRWLQAYGHTRYADDIVYQIAGALRAVDAHQARLWLFALVDGPVCSSKLSAYRALYFSLEQEIREMDAGRRHRRRRQLVALLLAYCRRMQQELERWPHRERLVRDSSAYAFNDAGQAHFLIGWVHALGGQYEQAVARYRRGLTEAQRRGQGVPPNIHRELALFHQRLSHWSEAFDSFDRYSRLDAGYDQRTWFLLYLRAAPLFVLSLGVTSLHLFLLMLLASVLLFSRATENRRHFRFALALALVYAAGQWRLLGLFGWSGQRSLSLALAVGAMIFLPLATGRAHWRLHEGGRWWDLPLQLALALALMAGCTALLVRGWSFRPSPFMRFLEDLPMLASVAQSLSARSARSTALLLVVLAALQEEALYRGFTLPVLARYFSRGPDDRRAWWIAQVVTALLWALAHAGMTEPQQWKFVQVAGLSLLLGELFRRQGLVACILAHGLFNVAAVLL